LVFQPTRLPLYAGFFLLGAYAWKRGWPAAQGMPGRPWAWGLAFIAALAVMARTGGAALEAWAAGAPSVPLSLAHGLARTAFALAATALAAALLGRAKAGSPWRRPGVSRTSFDLYLYHFPPVVALQYWLCGTALPAAAKLAVCVVLPILLCLGTSRLCGSRAWTRPALVGLAFLGCAVFWG
jgi:peptidoglycan/LPS O-acetylase OafA/YrhL